MLMKRTGFLFILGVLAIALLASSCGKKKVAEEVTQTPTTVKKDTPKTDETTTTPSGEKSTLKESQFQTVYFDYDKYNLRSDAKSALDANYTLLKDNSTAVVKIEGHCDERGTVEYNMALGERRARATMDYLVGLGVDAKRLSVISYGKERPAVIGSNEDAWSKNRRCEFRVISQ